MTQYAVHLSIPDEPKNDYPSTIAYGILKYQLD
jgi:hypothetical protein